MDEQQDPAPPDADSQLKIAVRRASAEGACDPAGAVARFSSAW